MKESVPVSKRSPLRSVRKIPVVSPDRLNVRRRLLAGLPRTDSNACFEDIAVYGHIVAEKDKTTADLYSIKDGFTLRDDAPSIMNGAMLAKEVNWPFTDHPLLESKGVYFEGVIRPNGEESRYWDLDKNSKGGKRDEDFSSPCKKLKSAMGNAVPVHTPIRYNFRYQANMDDRDRSALDVKPETVHCKVLNVKETRLEPTQVDTYNDYSHTTGANPVFDQLFHPRLSTLWTGERVIHSFLQRYGPQMKREELRGRVMDTKNPYHLYH